MSDPEILDRRIRRIELLIESATALISGRQAPAQPAADDPRVSDLMTRMEKIEAGENAALADAKAAVQELCDVMAAFRDEASASLKEFRRHLDAMEERVSQLAAAAPVEAPAQPTGDDGDHDNKPSKKSKGKGGD